MFHQVSLENNCSRSSIPFSMLYITRLMLYLNSAINPVLYNLTSTKFRDAFQRFLRGSSARDLLRQSTFTTATSMSNGRPGSVRSSLANHSPRCSTRSAHLCRQSSLESPVRQSSLEALSVPRRQILARYGRQGSFVTSSQRVDPIKDGGTELRGESPKHLPVTAMLATFGEITALPALSEISAGVLQPPAWSPGGEQPPSPSTVEEVVSPSATCDTWQLSSPEDEVP